MSLSEPLQENDQKGPEVRLQEDDETNEPDKNMRRKDPQSDKRSTSPFSFLKDDFSQFKEEVLKMFKDKDMKTELEDHPQSQRENKPASRTLSLLKEFKEDMTNVFSVSSSKDKETKSAEKPIDRLSSLKQDLSNVFRLSKERDAGKEDTLNTFRTKSLRAESTNEPFKSLFRRDQKIFQKAKNRVQETLSETNEEQVDDGFSGNLSEKKEEKIDGEKINNMERWRNEVEESEVERIPASQPGRLHRFHSNNTFIEKHDLFDIREPTCLS